MTTAIIIRPETAPDVRVLECDGPFDVPRVNHIHGTNVPVLSYEEWKALPPHLRGTPPAPGEVDFNSACRIANILANAEETKNLSLRQLREIRWRLELIFPCCTSDDLRRQPVPA